MKPNPTRINPFRRDPTTDCLIIGFNDADFDDYVRMVKAMGMDAGAYRDLRLAFIEYEGRAHRALDLLSRFHNGPEHYFHNTDFLWPTILYLGNFLHRHGYTFDYVNLFQMEKEKLRQKLVADDILTVAITTTLYVSAHPILEMVSFIREHNPNVRIVIGGPYIANQAGMMDREELQNAFKYIGADIYVINREGEMALAKLIGALKTGSDLGAVENIAYRVGDGYAFTPCSVESNKLEENMVDYRLFPQEELGRFISLRTAKSCPFSCAFCGFPARAGKYTYLSVEHAERELNALCDAGEATTLTFLDDTFNVPKERFKELLRMMIRNKYGFHWNSFYRSDHGDEETIELMRQSGCEGVFLGAESGSDTMLKKMNKTSRRKNYFDAICRFREAGIITHANFIVGFPGETRDTFDETVGLIEDARPDFFRAQLWYADPLTPVWRKREEHGIQGMAFAWSHHTMDSATACDLVDEMFLTIKNSLWLPQWGFELWSVFYLQRWGMTRAQLKNFVRCFNAVIQDRLRNPSRQEIPSALLDELQRSCQFNSQPPAGRSGPSIEPAQPNHAVPSREARPKFSYTDLPSRDYEQILKILK
jgi:anaerobic magnesium-protoporphyrin IX monomethyl ester cyclase